MKTRIWIVLIGSAAVTAAAQAQPPASGQPSSQPAAAPATSQADAPAFKPEELEQMLAPIALYPDSLLSQVLMASTYPLEIIQADRWAKANKEVKDDAAAKALEAQPWDA